VNPVVETPVTQTFAIPPNKATATTVGVLEKALGKLMLVVPSPKPPRPDCISKGSLERDTEPVLAALAVLFAVLARSYALLTALDVAAVLVLVLVTEVLS
jgi:hypothetical protein